VSANALSADQEMYKELVPRSIGVEPVIESQKPDAVDPFFTRKGALRKDEKIVLIQ
jgi:hypothetical protein